jgi:hypothetical protein
MSETTIDRRDVLRSLAGAGVVAIGSGPASAQSEYGGNSTESDSSDTGVDVDVSLGDGNSSSDSSSRTTPEPVVAQVTPTVDLLDYTIDAIDADDRARLTLTLRLKTPEQIVTSDMFGAIGSEGGGGGVTQIPQNRETRSSGRHEVVRTVGTWEDNVGVSLAAAGGAVWISDGTPVSGTDVDLATGVMTGVGTALGAVAFAADRKLTGGSKAPSRDDDGGLL